MKKVFNVKIFLLFFGFALTQSVIAQNDSLNRQKYWCLRERFLTKFIKLGLGTGESIPAIKYTVGISWSSNPPKIVKKIEWGDALLHHGYYMGVLATEIELLQRSGKDQDEYFQKLVEELYFALNTINRLDDAAEIIWGYAPEDCHTRIDKVEPVLWDSRNNVWLPKPGSGDKPVRNGFCLRMDGNVNLLEYFTDASSIFTQMVRVWMPSDTLNLKPGDVNYGKFGYYNADPFDKDFQYRANGYYPVNEISQDQMFSMLLGIMLIAEFVDPEIKYQGIPLNSMAREIGLRLIAQYKGTEFRNPKRPNRGVCNLGGNSFPFWQSIKKVRSYLETGKKNQIKDQILLWGKKDCVTSYVVNRSLYITIASIANSTPQQDLCRYAVKDGFSWGFFYLVRRAIYNPPVKKGGCTYTAEDVKSELNLCPFRGPHCDAFEYGPNGNYMIPDGKGGSKFHEYTRQEMVDSLIPLWCVSNRHTHECVPTSGSAKRFVLFQGEFNGLDYMLQYNLACIVFGMDAMGGNYTATRDFYFPDQPMIEK